MEHIDTILDTMAIFAKQLREGALENGVSKPNGQIEVDPRAEQIAGVLETSIETIENIRGLK